MEFPYSIRASQKNMVDDIAEVLDRGTHLVAEAPTGFGKTITSLYPTIRYAVRNDKKVLYLVRTNSQEQKVIEECKKLGVTAVAMQGRRNMCPFVNENPDMEYANAEELSLLCKKLKDNAEKGNSGACPYFEELLKDPEPLTRYILETHTAEEVLKKGVETGICPYEATKNVMNRATVIVLPYIYFLNPFMRTMLLERMHAELHDIILIVDEAHNFPDFARELVSDELSEESLNRMEKECLKYENRELGPGNCADIAEFIKEAMLRLEKYTDEEEGLVPQYAFEEELASILGIGINEVPRLALKLIKYGMEIREEKMKHRKIPRSYIYHVGNFLMYWKDTYSQDFLHLVRLGKTPKLEIFCLDPANTTEIIRNVHSSIHMSGTLVLDNYRALINLPEDTKMKRYPSPFPRESLKVVYAKDVTTRYAEVEQNLQTIANYIDRIASFGKSTVVFFPSYTLLKNVSAMLTIRPATEKPGMSQSELSEMLRKFRTRGGVLLSVFGGRVSEGLDFPGKQLEIVVIAGIPFPKPTARVKMLEKYFDYKFGSGWDFAFRVPALIKIRQAIGRLIRTEKDRGMAIILDRRAAQFSEDIPMSSSKDICTEIQSFFNSQE